MTTTHTFKDIAASVVTSGYKWLTQTLLTAQQQFNVRPYYTAQVIDDTIQPNAQFFSGGSLQQSQGSMVSAPDGKVFSVGVNAGALEVWSSADLHDTGGVFSNAVTLNTSGDNCFDPANNFSISCSAYYNGVYRLCVWYFANFINDGSNLTIKLQYSDDDGNTWNKISFTPGSMPNNAHGNLSIAAMTPFLFSDGAMKVGCFYIKNSTDIYYNFGDSGGYSSDVKWNMNANSGDWTLHSLSSYSLFNGTTWVPYCVFSGFRSVIDAAGVNSNFSIFITAILNLTRSSTSDLWMAPTSAMPVGSASSTNLNSFTLPWSEVLGGLVYITFQAVTVDSLAQTSQGQNAQVVTTHTNYMVIASDNGINFSYPSVLVGTDGTEFESATYASLAPQNGYVYLGGGNGWLWELVQNHIVADISADVIGYQIQETSGQPVSLNLNIANANNKWVGANPTGAGAAAIALNRKVCIWQGYYNPNGTPEAVPRNIFYIDDIMQTVTGTQNDVTLVCRDLYKQLKTTVTKFSYQFNGPTFFTDIFDGTFTSSWNPVSGTWQNITNVTPPFLELAQDSGSDNVYALVGSNGTSYGSLYRVFFRSPATTPNPEKFHFYGMYIDSNNWLRLELDMFGGTAWAVKKNVAGSISTMDSGTLPFTINNSYFGVIIRRYGYFKFNFMVLNQVGGTGNDLTVYSPSTTTYVAKNGGTGEYDLTGTFSSPFTVALGTAGTGLADFRFFFYTEYNGPNSLGNVIRNIARIAGIFKFKLTYTWRELLFTNNFSGGTILNRNLTLPASTDVFSTANVPFSNGEITFKAKITVANSSNPAGFSFLFRHVPFGTNGQPEHYKFHAIQQSTGFLNPPVSSRFERYVAGLSNTYLFYNTPYDVSNNPFSGLGAPGSINYDLTQWNNYRIVMIDGWFYAFINDVMVASWNDNNTLIDYLTTGTWGFECDANTTLQVKQIEAPNFWKPIQAFSLNPGDDMESAIESLTAQLRAYFFSDLFGRFKVIFLGESDPSTYSYSLQLSQSNIDQSDKEWVSQVTVNGNGVIATARDTSLMAGVPTREEIITDYTITTQQDAQTRADNELINANQYLAQYSPMQVMNVGAELFDAVTIINTGNNTLGADAVTRVYAETFNDGGGNNNGDYSLELSTGDL